jgi:hypothetical protein
VACKAFIDAFPELGFLHLPTIVVWSSEITTLDVNAMQGVQPMHLLLASVTTVYASMTRGASKSPLTESTMSRIRSQVFESEISSLIHVQTLLVVSMHEWGKGHSRQAWVTCGTAIRTMQTLLTHEPSKSTHPQEWQIFNRTLWSCYIMDRMIVSGVSQPNMLTCEALHTPWPSSSANFAFGTVGANMESARSSGQLLRNMTGDILHCYDTVVRGLDIWARILKWFTSGGRRFLDRLGRPFTRRSKHGGNFKSADCGSPTRQSPATLLSAKLNNSHMSTLSIISGMLTPPHCRPPFH